MPASRPKPLKWTQVDDAIEAAWAVTELQTATALGYDYSVYRRPPLDAGIVARERYELCECPGSWHGSYTTFEAAVEAAESRHRKRQRAVETACEETAMTEIQPVRELTPDETRALGILAEEIWDTAREATAGQTFEDRCPSETLAARFRSLLVASAIREARSRTLADFEERARLYRQQYAPAQEG